MRTCICCQQSLPIEAFNKNATYKCGYAGKCRECCKAYLRKYSSENRDAQKVRSRAWYERNKPRILAENRSRTAEDRRPSRARYYQKHRERIVAKAIDTVHRRRTQGGSGVLTAEEWMAKVSEFDGRCAYCMAKAKLSRDHVIPLSRGGEHSAANIVPCCKRCNSSKNNRLLSEWLW